MGQNHAISLPQQSLMVAPQTSQIVAGQHAQGVAIAVEPMTFQETSLAFQPGASGCFLRVLWVLGFFVLLILVVYGTQWLFAAAGGF